MSPHCAEGKDVDPAREELSPGHGERRHADRAIAALCRGLVPLAVVAVSVVSCCGTTSPRRSPELGGEVSGIGVSSRGEWRARLEWPDDCENAFELSYAAEGSGVESHDLGHDQSLVTVACAGGAYQPSHRVYLLDAATSPPTVAGLAFPVYESADGLELELFDRTEIWGEIHVRPEHREISLLTLSRQLRDCGVWARYSVVAGGVERVESRALIPCPSPPGEPVDPEPGRPPAEWPVTRVPDGTPER